MFQQVPMWVFILLAFSSAIAVAWQYTHVPSSRRVRLYLLLGALAGAAGVILVAAVWRSWENGALLVFIDATLAALMFPLFLARNTRRSERIALPAGRLPPATVGHGGTKALLAVGVVAVLASGEYGLGYVLPAPAQAACRDYSAWTSMQAHGNDARDGLADLTRAMREAPNGPLKHDLTALVTDINVAVSNQRTSSNVLYYSNFAPDTAAVAKDCQLAVPAGTCV